MESEEKKIISEQTQAMKDLITELRNTHAVLSVILPEIKNTDTIQRIKEEREAFVKRNL